MRKISTPEICHIIQNVTLSRVTLSEIYRRTPIKLPLGAPWILGEILYNCTQFWDLLRTAHNFIGRKEKASFPSQPGNQLLIARSCMLCVYYGKTKRYILILICKQIFILAKKAPIDIIDRKFMYFLSKFSPSSRAGILLPFQHTIYQLGLRTLPKLRNLWLELITGVIIL